MSRKIGHNIIRRSLSQNIKTIVKIDNDMLLLASANQI